MSEASTIEGTDLPRTRRSLAADLRALGVREGSVLMVHSSLSALGWVAGQSVAVIQALSDALGPLGTLAMPTFTGGLTDPAHWQHPPVPQDWWPIIRAETPAFDPSTTPTRMMGAVAETFRSWPGTLRSDHPHVSVAALGPQAAFITKHHALADSMGEGSPFARLYELDAFVLLLGTERNSSLHLAEHRSGTRGHVTQGGPILERGQQVWREFQDLDYDDDHFPAVKAAFEATGAVTLGRVGSATAKLMRQRELVDYGTAWFKEQA